MLLTRITGHWFSQQYPRVERWYFKNETPLFAALGTSRTLLDDQERTRKQRALLPEQCNFESSKIVMTLGFGETHVSIAFVAGGCLVALLVGFVLITRWKFVDERTDDLSDVEKGVVGKYDAPEMPESRSLKAVRRMEKRGTKGSSSSIAGGSARPM